MSINPNQPLNTQYETLSNRLADQREAQRLNAKDYYYATAYPRTAAVIIGEPPQDTVTFSNSLTNQPSEGVSPLS